MTYPVFLKLNSKKCVVVGAGKVAERKISALLDADADVLVIAPVATEAIQQLAASENIAWLKRDFAPGDLDNAFLVIAATNNRQTNNLIHQEADRRNTLINVADTPELCNFFVPAVVERGLLKIAVSTSGASPALAARLRARFENELGPEYADYVNVIADFRREIMKNIADPAERKRAYDNLLSSNLLEQVKQGAPIDVGCLVKKHAV